MADLVGIIYALGIDSQGNQIWDIHIHEIDNVQYPPLNMFMGNTGLEKLKTSVRAWATKRNATIIFQEQSTNAT